MTAMDDPALVPCRACGGSGCDIFMCYGGS